VHVSSSVPNAGSGVGLTSGLQPHPPSSGASPYRPPGLPPGALPGGTPPGARHLSSSTTGPLQQQYSSPSAGTGATGGFDAAAVTALPAGPPAAAVSLIYPAATVAGLPPQGGPAQVSF
jgi:hypothetical protein